MEWACEISGMASDSNGQVRRMLSWCTGRKGSSAKMVRSVSGLNDSIAPRKSCICCIKYVSGLRWHGEQEDKVTKCFTRSHTINWPSVQDPTPCNLKGNKETTIKFVSENYKFKRTKAHCINLTTLLCNLVNPLLSKPYDEFREG